jgi:hypothetical protein
MTTPLKFSNLIWIAVFPLALAGCFVEDPGPRQLTEHQYPIVDFDRLEIGSGLHITVEKDDFFSINASGDRRNIEDLVVKKEGTTLVIQYKNFRERRHDTFIQITMPDLSSVNFSGASESRVDGFVAADALDVYLSGGSLCQMNVDAPSLKVVLSGASYLSVRGTGELLNADISGSSAMKAFAFEVAEARLSVSGASDAQITAVSALDVIATGASHVVYRGNPSLTSEVSGSSLVQQE